MIDAAYTDGQKRDRLIHSPKGGHVDGLTTHCTLRTDTCRVFSRTGVDDRIHQHLGTRIRKNKVKTTSTCPNPKRTHLDRILVREEMNNLKRMCDDADGQQFLAIIAAFHHQASSQIKVEYASDSRSVRMM